MHRSRKCIVRLVFCTLMLTGVSTLALGAAAMGADRRFAQPDPPEDRRPAANLAAPRIQEQLPAPTSAWTYHKTADNQHPSGLEQQMLWLMNRARANPAQEGTWLAALDDPDVAGARSYFNVDLDVLRSEFAALAAKPPAAFDARLYQAARNHSDYLIQNDAQNHDGQFDRVAAAGFDYEYARGNVFSYTRSALHGHAGFNIDWGGSDGTGMQPGRGHRKAIMSIDGNLTNVGLAMVAENDPGTDVGPYVTTGNYCSADVSTPDHYNRFLVGTVWRDLNANQQYDPGEGMGGIDVRPDSGGYYAVTADSGGYAIPVDAGTYTVTFSGSGLAGDETRTVTVGDSSFLLDLAYNGGSPSQPEAVTGAAGSITRTTARLNGRVNANGRDVDYYFEYGATTQYGDVSDVFQTTANQDIAVALSGLSAGTLYHHRLVVVSDTETVYGNDRSFTTATDDTEDPQSPDSSGGGGGGGCFVQTLHAR